MLLANGLSPRLAPTPDARATCPQCGGEVAAKCGRLVPWHWAHVVGKDCDPWSEPMTRWHRGWQDEFDPDQCEIVIGDHRADVVTRGGEVIELQHSTIGPDEIAEREAHYGRRLVWVFDAIEAVTDGRLEVRKPAAGKTAHTFRWRHPRKSLTACRRTVFLDLDGDRLLRLGRLYPDAPCGGWGTLVRRSEFLVEAGAVGF